MHEKEIKVFMSVCEEFATLSHCISKKVAVVAVKDRRIIATGINGTIPGQKNCDCCYNDGDFTREEHHEWSLKNEVHAEVNMIAYCAKHGISLEGATVFSTLQPCADCSKALAVSGISKVIYKDEYAFTPPEASVVLKSANIIVSKFKE
ncbi:deoxycytidylate deaminase [Vibrio phage 2.275.O._10N.286.54.E11]|nr:deoxycytidylate deaminase [Vibrio phage 2.275.O._10N.286.54.E11]